MFNEFQFCSSSEPPPLGPFRTTLNSTTWSTWASDQRRPYKVGLYFRSGKFAFFVPFTEVYSGMKRMNEANGKIERKGSWCGCVFEFIHWQLPVIAEIIVRTLSYRRLLSSTNTRSYKLLGILALKFCACRYSVFREYFQSPVSGLDTVL